MGFRKMEAKLDAGGNLPLPEGVRKALGWEPGQAVLLQVEGDQLLVQPAGPAASLKDEARRLADSMRELTSGAVKQVAQTVTGLAKGASQPSPSAPTAPAPAAAGPARVEPFQGVLPTLGARVYLAPGSYLSGDVGLGDDVSLWPGVAARGDVARIRVGARSNVQDGAVLHVSPEAPCLIGAGVTIGHQATVHACRIGDDTLIGIQAVVLDGAVIGRHCIIAAGAVVPPGMEVPDGKMVMGVPAKVVRDLTPAEIERIHWNADSYVTLKNQYLAPAPAHPEPQPPPPPAPAPPVRGALPRHEVRRAAGEIVIDGSLDDPGWEGVTPLSALVHSNNGSAPAQETEVRLCWDDECLYAAFACKDTDIWADFENRDDPLYDEEVVEVFLCPTGDLRHYFEFEVNPLNTLFDAKVFNPEGDRKSMLVDREWNAARIRTSVRVSGVVNDRTSPDIGWITELAIPFADLGLPGPPAPGTVWRANFYRIERGAVTEFTAWSPTYREPADFHVPACFGEIVFQG
jgi:carbonic anhydrase/acetyltransferase-like protein (isoleucine patch superfamily)/bifunctional DNA-binding transcriptional regulator/antitoxin component of YhaV-PrlF toxin-antitoxin module